jgi:hypothetical protein
MKWSKVQLEATKADTDLDLDPYRRATHNLSEHDLAWIESEENQLAMKLPETRALQKKLTAYYRQVKEVETNMVLAAVQQVLLKVNRVGAITPGSVDEEQPELQPNSHNDPDRQQQQSGHAYAYPFPAPNSPDLYLIKDDELHDNTFSQPRGVLYSAPHLAQNYLYDHNYRATWVDIDDAMFLDLEQLSKSEPTSRQTTTTTDRTATAPSSAFHPTGRVLAQGAFSMLSHFRRRSEWALELLIVGCLGLESPQLQSPQYPSLPLHPNQAAWTQHSEDSLLQRIPTFFNALQPTPTPPPHHGFDPQSITRLSFYHDTLSHLTLLSTLPLCETLASLAPLPPGGALDDIPTQ